mgnify:CR=1 FL=1
MHGPFHGLDGPALTPSLAHGVRPLRRADDNARRGEAGPAASWARDPLPTRACTSAWVAPSRVLLGEGAGALASSRPAEPVRLPPASAPGSAEPRAREALALGHLDVGRDRKLARRAQRDLAEEAFEPDGRHLRHESAGFYNVGLAHPLQTALV